MTRRRTASVVALALSFLLLLTACTGGKGSDSVPGGPDSAAQPSAPQSAPASGTPQGGSAAAPETGVAMAGVSSMRPAPDSFRKLTYEPGATVTDAGIFFLSTRTGEVEGWALALPGVNDRPAR